ncbi:hypothetical protein K3X48_05880 [Aliiroseovarius crassostreae]|uniref:Uncharacterized protein n=1 Tax=Aliiroseovarius crassostreae TaxID=154981 RepID=A0A9Q9HAE4_9RHOB|nr:hypothetical protein [Aliiroseovarius crassostreae]UWP96503.1 hypothetical protein K3X48_05880 [Aliiroseovarius crassostreae]
MFDLSNDTLTSMRAFMASHSEAVQNAAYLLGGQPALRKTQSLLDDIASSLVMTRRLAQNLLDLHALLTLQNVHCDDTIEAACFADLDPASPIVEDICVLCDELEDEIHKLDDAELSAALSHRLAA